MSALDRIVLFGAALAAIVYTWRNVVRPLLRIAAMMEASLPVILEIAKEFDNNGGTTLKDVIDHLNLNVDEQMSRLDKLEMYVHQRFHDVIAMISKLEMAVDYETKLQDLRDEHEPERPSEA